MNFSADGGKTWYPLKSNLPTVAVHDLAVKNNTLVVGTHGRAMWAFDHLSVLREWKTMASDMHLFSAPETIRWRYAAGPSDKFAGQNPLPGAVIYYYLKEEPKSDLTIDILDAAGIVVRTLSSKARPAIGFSDNLGFESNMFQEMAIPKAAGVNAAVWDLRHTGSELIENGKLDFGGPVVGPTTLPGVYTVRLNVTGKQFTTKLNLLPDPRVKLTEAEYRAQRELALAIRDDVSRLTLAVRQIRAIRTQLKARNELIKNDPRGAQLVADSAAMVRKLDELEEQIHNPKAEVVYDILAFKGGAKLYSRIAFLHDVASESDGPPTQGVREVYAEQKRELDGYDAALKKLIGELASLNAVAKKLDYPHIIAQETSQLTTMK